MTARPVPITRMVRSDHRKGPFGRWCFGGAHRSMTPRVHGRLSVPIVVNGFAYVASACGMVWALDLLSGAIVWSEFAGFCVPYWYSPVPTMVAGQGMVLVQGDNLTVAYESSTSRTPAQGWGWNRFGQVGTPPPPTAPRPRR